MTHNVVCPQCRANLLDGGEFEVVIPYKAASSNELAGLDQDGVMILGAGDAGQPTHFGRPELVCMTCGHQWVTIRGWTP